MERKASKEGDGMIQHCKGKIMGSRDGAIRGGMGRAAKNGAAQGGFRSFVIIFGAGDISRGRVRRKRKFPR